MVRALRILLVCLAIASTGQAQQLRGTTGQEPAGPSLRGAVSQSASNGGSTTSIRRAIGLDPVAYGSQGVIQPLPSASPRLGGVAQQCRMSCAQTYYFCLAGNQIDDCPASWSQCRAGCSSAPLSSSY